MAKTDENPVGYTYGPVPSRRLGLSLGVDIVPPKICTLDCIYCQLGHTTEKTADRGDFVDIRTVIAEVGDRLAQGIVPDYITIGGSGEPTLNSRLGELIDGIRELTSIPIAIITNGTLLYRSDVRAECVKADLVVPSLDAGDEAVFSAVNQPISGISIEKLVSGLAMLRDEFAGQIWLEVFLVEGFNTSDAQIQMLAEHIRRIRPDKVQLNSAVRPAADPGVRAIDRETLEAIARRLGANCEVVGAAPAGVSDGGVQRNCQEVLSMLKRRPCSMEDICTGLGIHHHAASKYVAQLLETGMIFPETRDGITYYRSHSS